MTPEEREAVILKTRKEVMAELYGDKKSRAQIIEDERDKFRKEATDGLLFTVGRSTDENSAFAGWRPIEMARVCVERAGLDLTGGNLQVLGRALTSSDFPNILANVANKSLFEGFDSYQEGWRQWCGVGTVNDFKPATLAMAGAASDLDKIEEGQEYKYGDREDAAESFQLATYGKLFAITRQAIINDDLSALTDVPYAHGEAAARKIGDLVYDVLTGTNTMRDGKTLFHADHANIGTAAAVSPTSLAEGIALMRSQKDISGRQTLNIRPRFFIAPVALEGSCELMFNSEYYDATSTDTTRANPYRGSYFSRIYEPRLDDSSESAWYLVGPKGKSVRVFFLPGGEKPYLEKQSGWAVDGAEYKVRIDVAAKALDWRPVVKNAGA